MKTVRFALVCLLLNTIIHSHSQRPGSDVLQHIIDTTSNDSLRAATFYDLAFATRLSDLDLAQRYSDSGFYYYTKVEDVAGMHLKDYLDAALLHAEGDYESAIQTNQRYLDWTIASGNVIRQTYAVSSMAKFHRELGHLGKAVDYTLRGIALQDSLGRSFDNGFYYAELGDLYSIMQQWQLAFEYIKKSYDLAVESGYREGQAISLRNMGGNAMSRNQLNDAEDYIRHSIVIDSIDGRTIGLCRAEKDLGVLLEKKNNPAAAYLHYQKALEYIENTENHYDFAQIYQGMARVQMQQGNLRDATNYLVMSDQHGEEIDRLEFHRDQESLRAQLLGKDGKFKDAFSAAMAYQKLQNELLTNEIGNQITGLNARFESEKRGQQIALLNAENEVASLELSAANRRTWGFAIFLLLLGVGAFILFQLYRRIQSQNKIITDALNEKDLLLREIHHRVKNNLQVISSLLNLQARHVDDVNAQDALKEGKDRIRSMALIHQNLYQEHNLTGIEIKDYFQNLTESLFKSYNIAQDRVQLKMSIQQVNLDIDTVIPLGLIVNELISNALKHAFPSPREGTVSLDLKEDQGILELTVSDNGVGISDKPSAREIKTFGYRLIQTFQKKLSADLSISNHDGTTVVLKIKNYQKVA